MKKIKTALVSYGMSGKVFHAPFLKAHDGYELVGAWERSTKNIQNDYPETKSYDTIEALLNDTIDLVVVNTPVNTHYEYAKKALQAGKHVLVEKAFTTNAAEAEELQTLAKQKGLKLTVYQNRRWDSDFKTVQKVLQQNLLGDIIEAEIHFDRYNPNLSPKAHKETGEPGAGVLWDLGSHIIDQALVLFGYPKAVFADIRKTRENSKIDDWFDIVLYYTDKRVRVKAGFFMREPIHSYILHGKKGSFLKSRADVQEDELKEGKTPDSNDWGTEPKDKEGLLHTEINGEVVKKRTPTEQGNYSELFERLYNSIINNTDEPVTAAEGVQVMKIIDAVQESSALKQVVEL
ncbi:oxidoreductase [Flavobacterium arcticum]|uniref:Oxidoreductase n=1 Tax=Flavobacterium arcticum TaxID=1784713 RepID=A0A345HB74_9FLAO|nr:Gfo/Idh/MocA family oxidoreductase [Flavobacterium arcticum]AXG73834.1 oxidoreductase [Flavobacterium arcticum]KAF2511786.1 Gfo/Idh/MocA family oxidoreductase [Flavobacterium arcticum]